MEGNIRVAYLIMSLHRIEMNDFYHALMEEFYDNIDILDIRGLYPKSFLKYMAEPPAHEKSKKEVITIDTYAGFEEYLKSPGKKVIIKLFSGAIFEWRMLRLLKKYNADIVARVSNSTVTPENMHKSSAGYREKYNFFRTNLKRVSFLLYLALVKVGVFPKTKLLFISGKELIQNITKYRCRFDEIIEINSSIYDNFLKNRYPIEEKCIVFLDANIPFEPEYEMRGFADVDEIRYYECLNRTFDYFEEASGKKVVICAHPSYNMQNASKHFHGREVVQMKTDEYVSKAMLVLINSTSAINRAVMYKKPIIQMDSDCLNKFVKNEIKLYNSLLQLSVLDFCSCTIEDAKELLSSYHYKEELYEKYINDFLRGNNVAEQSVVSMIEEIKKRYFVSDGVLKQ